MQDTTDPRKDYLIDLGAPPEEGSYAQILSALREAGVRPPSAAERARQRSGGGTAKPGQKWRNKTLGAAAGLGEKQIQRYCNGLWLPPRTTHAALMAAIFGSDQGDYPEWRRAMQDAWDRETKPDIAADLQLQTCDFSTAQAAIGTNSIHIAPVRVPIHFFGRDEYFDVISEALSSHPRRAALFGVHGVGKSVLAAAYAARPDNDHRAMGWIDCNSPDTITRDLAKLGVRLNYCMSTASPEEAASATLSALSVEKSDILLVYDDARDPHQLHPFLPAGDSVKVLITSTSPNWRAEAKPIEVSSWSVETGAEYLARRLGQQHSAQERRAVAAELQGLPIALEIAASYAEQRALPLEFCRRIFVSAPVARLSDARARPTGYPRTFIGALLSSIEAADEQCPGAGKLLQLSSVFGPAPIPLQVLNDAFLDLREGDSAIPADVSIADAVAALRAYSLVTLVMLSPDRASAVSLHSVVRMIASDGIQSNLEHRRAISNTLLRHFPLIDDEIWHLPIIGRLVPLAEHHDGINHPSDHFDLPLATLRLRVGAYHRSAGRHRSALKLFRRALRSIKRSTGRHSLPTAEALNAVGGSLSRLGAHHRAECALTQALAIRRDLLPQQDTAIALTLLSLAAIVSDCGQHERASALAAEADAIYSLSPENGNADRALQYFHIGISMLLVNRQKEAQQHLEQALALWSTASPADLQPLAVACDGLAQICLASGEVEPAVHYCLRGLALLRDHIPAQDPHLARARLNSAVVRFRIQETSHEEFELSYDLNSLPPDTERSVALRLLAHFAWAKGRFDTGRQYAKEAFDMASAKGDEVEIRVCELAIASLRNLTEEANP